MRMCVFVVWRLGCVSLSLFLSISLFLALSLFFFSVPHYTCRAISSLTVKHQGLFKRSSLIRNCLEELLFSFQAAKITVIKLKISTVFIYLLILIGRRNMGLIIIFPHFLSFGAEGLTKAPLDVVLRDSSGLLVSAVSTEECLHFLVMEH